MHRREATIDGNQRSGDVSGAIRYQEGDQVPDLLRGPVSAGGDVCDSRGSNGIDWARLSLGARRLECKVSNSATNSVKRLNRETGGKARDWNGRFGERAITGAVLAGVFKLRNLKTALG